MKQASAKHSVVLGVLMLLSTLTVFILVIAYLALAGKQTAEVLASEIADMPGSAIVVIFAMLIVTLLALIALLVYLIYLIVRDTRRRSGKWGANFRRFSCPRCGSQQPAIRYLTAWRQIWWGGRTCRACGCQMDKWGVEVVSPH